MKTTIDHLVIVATDLDTGCAFVTDALGVALQPGGVHSRMGTHNRLLHLGPGLYLEVIAVDPSAIRPDRARWFGLDQLAPIRRHAWRPGWHAPMISIPLVMLALALPGMSNP